MKSQIHQSNKKNKYKHLLYIGVSIFIAISLLITAASIYFFLNLGKYQPQIKELIYQNSGFELNFDNLSTGFNRFGEPELNVKNLSLHKPNIKDPFIKIQKINLSLSYLTLIYWQPIFDKLNISGSNINLEYDKANNLLINHQIIANFTETDKHNSGQSYNWLRLLGRQRNIDINNINLVWINSNLNLQPIFYVNNIQFNSINHDGQHELKLNTDLLNSKLVMLLKVHGANLDEIKTWNDGNFTIHNIGKVGYLVDLVAQVKDGSVSSIMVKLDSNKQLANTLANSSDTVSDFKGLLKVDQDNNKPDHYTIDAKDLSLNTPYGYLFDDASINGSITIKTGGNLNIKGIELDGFNSLIKLTNLSDKLYLSGSLNTIHIDWLGKLLERKRLHLSTDFNDISLNSKESNLPSFNNLNGEIIAQESLGSIKLSLNSSTIKYPKFLREPITNLNFASNLNWQIESLNKLKISWKDTSLSTQDFNLSTNGMYDRLLNKLDTKVDIKQLNLAKIYKYMPTSMSPDGVKYIKQSFVNGYLKNAQISVNGDPREIPFKKGGGDLIILGQLVNTNFNFMNGWDGLKNLNGTLTEHNEKIDLKLSSGNLGKLSIKPEVSSISVKDITQKDIVLLANTTISGNTNDYLNYMAKTPFKKNITTVQNNTHLSGNSKLDFNLQLPLTKIEKFKFTGAYKLDNNRIILNKDILNINNINGTVNFSQRGLEPSIVTARSNNSPLELRVINSNQLQLSSRALNYHELVKKFVPGMSDIIHGSADTFFAYDLKKQKLRISSSLKGVTINAPSTLLKSESAANRELNFTMNMNNAPEIFASYDQSLFAHARFTSKYAIDKLEVALGTNKFISPANTGNINPKITLNMISPDFYIFEWTDFIQELAKNVTSTQSTKESKTSITAGNKNQAPAEDLFPIQVAIKSNAFWLSKYNFDEGKANFTIYPNRVNAEINTSDILGNMNYFKESNEVNIELNRLILSSTNWYGEPPQQKMQEHESSLNYKAFTESITVNDPKLDLAYMDSNKFESSTEESEIALTPEIEEHDIPTVNFHIKDLYLQNHYWGQLSGSFIEDDDSLYLENIVTENKSGNTRINLTSHCLQCGESDEYVALNVHSNIENFGQYVSKLDQGDMFKNGNGSMDLVVKWPGGLKDFKRDDVIGGAYLKIKNGELTHVNPGIFGALMGVINLSAINNITNINHFNFNSFFGNGFNYKNLETKVALESDILKIENLTLNGDVADVMSFGKYYFESSTIDSYVTLEPRLSGAVATTAGIVLTPIIGVAVYFGEKLIGEPINKALAVSYHVNGNVENPTLTQTEISKQLMQNFKSSINIFSSKDQPQQPSNY